MEIIGITGHPCAGKSTFSEMILKNHNIKVVHIDHLFDKLKKVMPNDSVNHYTRDDGEVVNYLNRDGLFYRLAHMNGINKIYDKLRMIYMRRELLKIIKESVDNGIQYLIVEGAYLTELFNVKLFDVLILIETEYDVRKERILLRDRKNKLSPEELFKEITLDYNFDYGLFDYIINNTGDMDELNFQAIELSNNIATGEIKPKTI